MKNKIILFSLSLFFISHYTAVKAMLFAPKKHRLDDIAQQIYDNFSGDKNSIFIAPPELFVLAVSKKEMVEFLQNNQPKSRSTNPSNFIKEKK